MSSSHLPWPIIVFVRKGFPSGQTMAAKIDVTRAGDKTYAVRVIEGNSQSSHRIELLEKDYVRLTSREVSPEKLIRLSFGFLLEHESKESILDRFDLIVISRYFPQYEREIKKRISGTPNC